MLREGKALLMIADPEAARAPHGIEPAWLPVFYNPRMTFNRDLSVLALEAYTAYYAPHKPIHLVDALSGTGVRAIRYSLETSHVETVHANDIDPLACRVIQENIILNGLKDRVVAHCRDAISLLTELRRKEPLLFIDVDPFGSPAPYSQQALKATGHKGLAAFTATDLAVLEASKPQAARRKYWVEAVKVPESKEVGVRILLGYLARVAASLDKSVRPLLAYYADHYYRVYLLVERGAKKADAMLREHVGTVTYCPAIGKSFVKDGEACPNGVKIGPLWVGGLFDKDYLEKLLLLVERYKYLPTYRRIIKLLSDIYREAQVCSSCIYYRLDTIASKLKTNLPPIRGLVQELEDRGYKAARTHFDPAGIRTDAPFQVVADLIRGWWR